MQETWLHTLGNLTLTGYNSEYSDRPFVEKRDMRGGLRESPLWLNEGLAALENWDEGTIKRRGRRLSVQAQQVWERLELSQKILEDFRARIQAGAGYTIDDHAFLAPSSPMRPLFDSFRKAVLSLDPSISEEFLKLYVAYEAETNFVDVVPPKSRLWLSLNLPFHELHDPRRLARDVTNLGRWGNGKAEVELKGPEGLAYVLGLVRQAFEKQMGADAVDA